MLDPSTNANPFSPTTEGHPDDLGESTHPWRADTNKKRDAKEVSKHTFFISNSQMKLKLVARNEVLVPRNEMKQMLILLCSGRCSSGSLVWKK